MKAVKPVNLEWVFSQNVKIPILRFFGGWKINSKDEGPWVWKILPNADVCVLNRFHQGQDNHLLSINKPRRWHTWQGRGRFWNSHDHNEVRKIRRWRSVIFDWFSQQFLRFDSSLHEFAESHMSDVLLVSTHFLKRWPFLEFLSGSSSSCNYFLVAHADAWHWRGWMVGVGQIGGMVVRYITVKGDVIPKNHLVVTSNDWRKEIIGNCVASITPVFQQKTQVGMSHCN